MKFAASHWLWLLGLAPLIAVYFFSYEKKRQELFGQFIHFRLWSTVAPEADFTGRLKKARLWIAAFVFLIFALARPQWGTHEEVIQVSGLDVVILFDVSNSMEVEDVVPSRLKKGQHLVKSILDRLQGDRASVVAFAGSNYLACPLTTDLDYVMETVQGLSPRLIQNQGTDIGAALDTAVRALERGAEQPSSDATAGSRVVILISDGEDHEKHAVEMAEKLKAAGVKFYVFGVGTEKGGPIPLRDENGTLGGYKKDHAGSPVVSSFRPDELTQLAALGGGKYWNTTTSETEVEELVQDLGSLSRSDYAEKRFIVYEERFQIPLAIALILMVLELGIPIRRVISTRGIKAALLPFFMVFAFGVSPPAVAGSLLNSQTSVGTYLENEKGLKAFGDGKTEEAKKHFGLAQERSPDSPHLEFNHGVIQLQEGDSDGAAQSFNEAARSALSQNDDAVAGRALYNLGVTQTKKGAIPDAAKSYIAALDAAKRSGDQSLEKDIRKNLELLIQEKKKQQEQKKKDKEGKGQSENQDPKKDKQDKSDKKDEKNQDKKKEDQQQASKQFKETAKEERKKQFRSEKLSKEDADRVMSELKDRERDLQQRLKRQNARVQSNAKDW